MENFVLYDEIGKHDGMVIYKGRRKGTIAFLAICCVDKNYRAEITNHVRFVHEFDQANIVKFFEWYETSNHLWLVIELCTGGTLHQVITEDCHLPESAIRRFGGDIVRGLSYIHSLDVLFADWSPKKIMLDGQGSLKFFDFSLARKEEENINELFDQFLEGMEDDGTRQGGKSSPRVTTAYAAPEILKGSPATQSSDMWGLGCLLYQMYCSTPPFTGDNDEQIAGHIVYREVPPPRARGSRVSGKPSPEFLSLIAALLDKDPLKRLTISQLVHHPFWRGELTDIAAPPSTMVTDDTAEEVSQIAVDGEQQCGSITPKEMGFKSRNSAVGTLRGLDSAQGTARTGRDQTDAETPSEHDDHDPPSHSDTSRLNDYRPRTAADPDHEDVSFTLHVPSRSVITSNSAVPPADIPDDKDGRQVASPANRTRTLATPLIASGLDPARADLLDCVLFDAAEVGGRGVGHTPLLDSSKLIKGTALKFDPKSLPVPPFSIGKLRNLGQQERGKHYQQVFAAFSAIERGPPSQKRLQLINYISTLALQPDLAQGLVDRGFPGEAVRQMKENNHSELRSRLLRLLGCLYSCVEVLDPECNLSEFVVALTELLRENFRVVRVKLSVLTALGELVCKIALAESGQSSSCPNWSIPSMTFTQIVRCLHRNEDVNVSLLAVRIIENLAAVANFHVAQLTTNEVGQLLWATYKHSTLDALRISSMSALCHLTKLQPSIFQTVVEKVGIAALLENLHINLSKVQASILTMFAIALIANPTSSSSRKLAQDRNFIQTVIRMLESPAAINRAKTFLILLAILENSLDSLVICCNHRLILYIERDIRRQTPSSSRTAENTATQQAISAYTTSCLERLQGFLVNCVPTICEEVLSSLDAVSGRKHPSTVQGKKLKQWLALLPCFGHFVTSHTLRSKIIEPDFLIFLGRLLDHCHSLDINETNIDPAVGSGSKAELISTSLSIVESISQHGPLAVKHAGTIISDILPPLGRLCAGSGTPDTRLISLKLFTDFTGIFMSDTAEPLSATGSEGFQVIYDTIDNVLMPQGESFLLDQEPSPCYFLKLVTDYITQRHAGVAVFQRLGLSAVLMQLILEHQASVTSSTMRQAMSLLAVLVGARDTNMRELFYEYELITVLCSTLLEIGDMCLQEDNRHDQKITSNLLLTSLDTLNTVLRHVSDVVRRALQSKKVSQSTTATTTTFDAAASEAEQLLLVAKPVTDLVGLLCQLLCYEDADVSESALRALSNAASLYGGEHAEAMTPENMHSFARALGQADAKRRRLMLRVIKRLLVTEKSNVDKLRASGAGQTLVTTIRELMPTATSQADATVRNLVREILEIVEV